MTKKNILGLITARGGSKRIPRKNIKDFLGKPLLGWTIEAGIKSAVFDKFVLSTEDEEIARVGKQYGVEVPFMRPLELAEDLSTSYDTVQHAVEWLRDNIQYEPEWVILLEPSSPGRRSFHIEEVAELLNTKTDIDSIIGISDTPAHFSYLKQLQVESTSGLVSRATDGELLRNLIHRNQDVPQSYFINSAIYAFKTSNLFDGHKSLWGEKTLGYKMDHKYAMDIDTPEDWKLAEIKMQELINHKDF